MSVFDSVNFISTRLQRKLVVSLALLMILVMGAVGFIWVGSQEKSAEAELEIRARRMANLLAKTLAEPVWNFSPDMVNEQLEAVMDDPEVFSVAFYEPNNEQPLALKQRAGQAVDAFQSDATVIYVLGGKSTVKELGVVRIVYTQQYLHEAINEARLWIGLVFLLFSGVLFSATYFLVEQMVQRPVREVVDLTKRIADGDFTIRIQVASHDEIGQLAESCNRMADGLESSRTSLTALNRDLEDKVAERTRALAQQATYLEASTRVAHVAASILERDELVHQVVNLIQERFQLYYVGLFMRDVRDQWAILCAGTGQVGKQLVAQGYRLKIDSNSMIGRSIVYETPCLTLDVKDVNMRFDNPLLPETRAEIALPLISRGRAIGALTLQSTQEQFFRTKDITALQTMAAQVAVALDNAALFQTAQAAQHKAEVADQVKTQSLAKAEARAEQLAALVRVTQLITSTLDLTHMLTLIAQEVVQLLHACNTGISLLDEARMYLLVIADHSSIPDMPNAIGVKLPLAGNLASLQVIETRQALVLPAVHTHPLATGMRAILRARRTTCLMLVPLLARGDVIGLIGVDTDQQERVFSASELALAETIAGQIAGAIETARLFEQTRERMAELDIVYQISQTLARHLDLDTAREIVGERLQEIFDTQTTFIYLYDRETELLDAWYLVVHGQRISMPAFPLGRGLTSVVIRQAAPLLISEDFPTRAAALGAVHDVDGLPRTWLGVPILYDQQVLGVMSVQNFKREHAFTENDVRLLTTIAANLGVVIRNARLYAEAQRARAVAESVSQAKGAFLATVSHELRTPLTSVMGFAKLSQKHLDETLMPVLPTDQRKVQRVAQLMRTNLNIIVQEGERLTALINDVLDLAKIEAGRVAWAMGPVALDEVLERATTATTALLQQKGLTLTLAVTPDLPLVYGDRDRLVQVVINLLSNAIKFTEQGAVTCALTRVGDELMLSVHDTGIGIAPEDQARVFEQFVQVGDTLTGKPAGTGLGLPICRQIIEHHQGRIWVESTLGMGSTFAFTLPIKESGAK